MTQINNDSNCTEREAECINPECLRHQVQRDPAHTERWGDASSMPPMDYAPEDEPPMDANVKHFLMNGRDGLFDSVRGWCAYHLKRLK